MATPSERLASVLIHVLGRSVSLRRAGQELEQIMRDIAADELERHREHYSRPIEPRPNDSEPKSEDSAPKSPA